MGLVPGRQDFREIVRHMPTIQGGTAREVQG